MWTRVGQRALSLRTLWITCIASDELHTDLGGEEEQELVHTDKSLEDVCTVIS